jgi:hypothetical protein
MLPLTILPCLCPQHGHGFTLVAISLGFLHLSTVQPLVQDHGAHPTRVERLQTCLMYAFPHIICVAICTHTDASQVKFDPGHKAMIYTIDGTPLHGILVLRTKDWAEGSCIQVLLAAPIKTDEWNT